MPLEGQHLGPYRLLHLLGSGGMGEVYLAEDARIGQQVAIKVIRAEGIASPESESAKEAARLFEREAKAITRLDHPNILPLYAYGEERLGEQLLTYLVMPYRKEGTLANWLRRRGNATPLAPAEVAPLLQQAAAALQHAHDQHVLHQDIKPTNFLIRLRSDQPERPDLLLGDFGIAKLTGATGSVSQSIRGTPVYMAPEQWDGHPVAASDQYALAVMVYELLVGRPPFVGNPGQVMRQHYLVPPPAPSTLGVRLSPAIDAVLLRALAKQSEERFASVSTFARAFQEAMQSGGDLHATLAISPAEAESGATRSLTLPGGRQVSVTVPAGVEDGSILRLEGQGMPYYEGGPAGPLVLTIAIPAEASQEPLPQDSMAPTVAVALPNVELPAVEEPSLPPALPSATGDREPPMPAPHGSETASTVLATNATSLPTEAATPAHQTAFVQPQQVAAIPSRPRAETSRKSGIVTTLVGIAIFAVADYLTDLIFLNMVSNAHLYPTLANWLILPSWFVLIGGLRLVVPFFFGARFGPWVGLCTAVIGSVLGDVISGYLAAVTFFDRHWYVYVCMYIAIATCGLFPGLAYRRSRGRKLSIRAALLFSLLGGSIYYIVETIPYGFNLSDFFGIVIVKILASLSALLLLFIALTVSNALGKNQIP